MDTKKAEKTDHTEAIFNQLRTTVYLMLSRVFSKEVDAAALTGIEQISGTLAEVWGAIALSPDPDIAKGQEYLRTFYKGTDSANRSRAIEELAREYASLFLGVGAKTVSPCESVYRSGAGLLYQSSHFEVQEEYRRIGMAKSSRYGEPDDHIAVELGFMARLCELIQESLGKDRKKALLYLELQDVFLKTRLMQWAPEMAKDIVAATSSEFYRGAAHLLTGYLRIDQALIEEIVQELKRKTEPSTAGKKRPKQVKGRAGARPKNEKGPTE